MANSKNTQAKAATAATQAAQTIPLREMGVPEAISRAIAIRRELVKKGRTTRRISFRLSPNVVPPTSGEHETWAGKVTIKSLFLEEGNWLVTVRLPDTDGFSIKDHQRKQGT